MKKSRVLIKLGGAALTDPNTRKAVITTLRHLRSINEEVVIVHGGGPTINSELSRHGIEWTFHNGQRVTTAEMMDVIEYSLCGLVNRSLVRHLGAAQLDAVGLAGSDRRTLLCSVAAPELGLVGKIEEVNAGWIDDLISLGVLPVLAPIGVGRQGEAYNINADWAASHLAAALKVDRLLFLTDQPGILDEEGQVIRTVGAEGLRNMMEARVVSGGMLAKTMAILHALSSGVKGVWVMNSQSAASTADWRDLGTMCSWEGNFAPPQRMNDLASPEAAEHAVL